MIFQLWIRDLIRGRRQVQHLKMAQCLHIGLNGPLRTYLLVPVPSTFPDTNSNKATENRPKLPQKEAGLSSNHQISGVNLLLVSGSGFLTLRPWKLTWIPKTMVWKMWFLLYMTLFGIYIKFLGWKAIYQSSIHVLINISGWISGVNFCVSFREEKTLNLKCVFLCKLV